MRLSLFPTLCLLCSTAVAQDNSDDPFDFGPSQFDSGFEVQFCTNTTASAGEPLLIRININKTATDEPRGSWNAYRLMLAKSTDMANAVIGPVCTYSDCLPLDTKTFTVVVDPLFGPSGPYYYFSASFFADTVFDQPTLFRVNDSQLVYSSGLSATNMTGMTGRFYEFESNPPETQYGHNWPDFLPIYPCAAYQCARGCVDKYYSKGNGTYTYYSDSVINSIKACADACPGAQTLTNNCPSVGGERTVVADGVDPFFIPDGCEPLNEGSSSGEDAEPTPTATSSPIPTDRTTNSGTGVTALQQGGLFGGIVLYLLLGIPFADIAGMV